MTSSPPRFARTRAEVGEFAELLAGKLEGALPRQTRVQRRRAGVLGPKRVWRIEVVLPSERLELQADQGSLQASWARVSGGIALKHETVGLSEWVDLLSSALAAEAERNDDARRALSALLI